MIIGVYGLGRFGEFWARLLSEQGFEVRGFNRSEREYQSDIHLVSLEEICRTDVLFICTSISSIPQVARQIASLLDERTLVVDTCSVKLFPLRELEAHLSPGQPIMGCHPMFGPDSAGDGVTGLPLVLAPWRNSRQQLEFWTQTFNRMGLRVVEMSADEHDLQAARTQGITHFIGRFLSRMELEPSPIGTLGYEKIFEVMEQTCNDPWQLFLDLQRYNPYTTEIRRNMRETFDEIIGLLNNQSAE